MASWKQGKIKFGFVETATSGGTLTLTSSSLQYQILTGTANHTVQLPNATTLAQGTGIAFSVVNVSTGIVTVKLNDTTTVLVTLAAGAGAAIYLTDNSTSNGVWVPKTGGAGAAAGIAAYAPGATKTSDYSIVSGDNSYIINVDTSAGAVNITLPTPVAGFKVTIKDIGGMASTNPIRVLRFLGTELIDNALTDTQIDENGMAISFESDGTNWSRMDSFHRFKIPTSGRGIFAGGQTPTVSSVIDYVTIATLGNATSFGSLTVAREGAGACSSSTRGAFGGGFGVSASAVIDYITIATLSNATSFGNLTSARQEPAGCSNSTRGVFGGGNSGGGGLNTIDYVTIAVLSNATSFGTLTVARYSLAACSSSTRGVFGGGEDVSDLNTIDYVTIATTSNATSFGTITLARHAITGCSNSIRGVFASGFNGAPSAVIDYVTIATTSNATSFGNLTSAKYGAAGCSSSVRATFGGGNSGSVVTAIDYITIATTDNASSFGNLTVARQSSGACSSSHGGLNG